MEREAGGRRADLGWESTAPPAPFPPTPNRNAAVHYYDSMAAYAGGLSRRLIGHLLHWLSDATAAKGGEGARLNTADWEVIMHPADLVPQQINGIDCGEGRERGSGCALWGRSSSRPSGCATLQVSSCSRLRARLRGARSSTSRRRTSRGSAASLPQLLRRAIAALPRGRSKLHCVNCEPARAHVRT